MVAAGLWFVGIVLVVFAAIWVAPKLGIGGGATLDTGTTINVPANVNAQCAQNPAYTYSGVDAFNAGTTVGGTDQIKTGADAPVTSLAAPTAGAGLAYWKQNATYFCEIKTDNAACGAHTLQADCIQNGTVTLSVRDLDNDVTLTNGGGANNLTVGANEVHNLELRYQSAAKKAVAPFGGCIAVEYPSTFTDVAVSGAGISSAKSCPYQWTYTVSSTSNTYRLFEVPAGFDKDGAGDLKKISVQLKSGSSNPSGTAYLKVQPANYYVGNDKAFHLGIEKDANADTTLTMGGGASTSFVIA